LRRPGAAAGVLLALTLVGCDVPLTNDDLLLCNAARFVTASIAGTQDALAIGEAGRPGEAAERAVQALGLAEGAARTLHEVDQAAQADIACVALLMAYEHAAQAARSLLPDLPDLRGSGDDAIAAARDALDEARLDLPPSCFVVPPG